ncbi:hypothetical protein [Streptomyces sp. AK02-04a]|nr:hypothetical protein [Streptomyces sp. AK02-04a]MDX3763645.1 hypothetical protein [Streptomyces sp. AK02-04a]
MPRKLVNAVVTQASWARPLDLRRRHRGETPTTSMNWGALKLPD